MQANCTLGTEQAQNVTGGQNASECVDAPELVSSANVIAIVRTFIYVAVLIFIVAGNLLVILVIARTPALQTNTNKFVTWLAAADALVGVSIFLRIVQALDPVAMQNYYVCMLRYYTIGSTGFMSGFCLLGIAIERYVGVFYSLHYERLITSQRIGLGMLVFVLYSLALPLIPVLGYNNWHPGVICDYYIINKMTWLVVLFIHFLIIQGLIVILHALIAHETRQSFRRIASLCPPEMIAEKSKLIKNTKAIKTFGLVSGILFISWGPVFIMSLAFAQDIDYFEEHQVWNILWLASTIMVLFNSSCNPIIYALRMTSFREPMLRLLKCGWNQSSEGGHQQSPVMDFTNNRVAPQLLP